MSRYVIWIVNGALFVLCCFLTAGLLNGWLAEWLAGPVAAAPPPRSLEAPPPRDWAARQVILQRNLFQASTLLPEAPAGPTPEELEEQLEATRLPLKLLGTVAASDPTEAWAAVEDTQQRRRLVVRPEDRLLEKATVIRIERRRIVLENDGRREELVLDEQQIAGVPGAPRTVAATPGVGDLRERVQRLSDSSFQVQRGDVQQAMRNPSELFTQARILPKYENGEMAGVQLNAIQPGSLFEQIGVRNGDVITEVNGIQVTSPQDSSRLLQELTQATEFQVEVVGEDGAPRTLSYVVQP
jgi:general secretion pathway protein C